MSEKAMRKTGFAILYGAYCVWMVLERDNDVWRFAVILAVITYAIEHAMDAFDDFVDRAEREAAKEDVTAQE